jgi:hypothetical protein
MSNSNKDRRDLDALEFTVSTVWREARVSCPHPDILLAWRDGALEAAAGEFVEFHLKESQCPYCNAVLEDIEHAGRDAEESAQARGLADRVFRSTVHALRHRDDERSRDR